LVQLGSLYECLQKLSQKNTLQPAQVRNAGKC